MALPPEPSESFVREVDENLRRDQAADFARRYGRWVAVAVVAFLLAVAGYLYWQQQREERASAQSEKLSATIRDIGSGNSRGAAASLDSIAGQSGGATQASARMARAALALQTGDRKAALAGYQAIAADDGLPQPYRDLATIRSTTLEFDQLKPADVIARLAPLATAESAWYGSAGELTVLAMIKQGDIARARATAEAVAAAEGVPASIKSRLNDLATTLPAAPPPAAAR